MSEIRVIRPSTPIQYQAGPPGYSESWISTFSECYRLLPVHVEPVMVTRSLLGLL